MPAYAELQVTTNFSFLRGGSHPHELAERAAALGLAAIAVTDRNSFAGIVRAWQAARRAGIRLVVGVRLDLRDGTSLLAFPEDRAAYGRLTTLLTLGKRRAPKGECHIDYADVVAHGEGQVVVALDETLAPRLGADFPGRAYLAAQHLYRGDDARRLVHLVRVAAAAGIPLVATNDVLYHEPARRPLQDVLTCIRRHCTIVTAGFRLEANAERHLKPAGEMARLFRGHEDALARTVEIAERCRFDLEELQYEYPEVPVPPGMTPQERLAQLAWEGAARKYAENPSPPNEGRGRRGPSPGRWEGEAGEVGACPPHPGPLSPLGGEGEKEPDLSCVPPDIRERIEHELALIERLDYARYFLTVHDIVCFAGSREILCQGRGSAANSVVCYCLGITAVNPSEIDVLFERFISAARGEPPDIDVDFEHERREEVIQFVYQRYGRDRAGLAATLITYRSRSAIREVGKVMGLSGDVVAALSGMVWGWSNDPIADKRIREAGLDPRDRNLRLAIDLAGALIGFPRHLSQHVGGFVITRGPLSGLVPIENAAMEDRTVIEWDKDDLDTLNILKIDILALGMLTCIRKAFALIERHHGRACTLPTIPREVPAVYKMLSRADSIGVFQVESRAQMSMLPRLKPNKFYDLVIEVAIVRPGPIQGDMVHPYLRRRNKIEDTTYPSPELRRVLEKTLGVPLFQEQAMQIAMVGAGFSADEADKLRRSMASFRRNGEIHLFRDKFIDGMVANGYPRGFAERCFSQIEGFGTYGFPESHAASFSLLVYASAWIKCLYPAAFACALLNSQPMGFYAPAQIVRDAREHGVSVLPADVNFSAWDCTLDGSIPDGASCMTAAAQPPQNEEKTAYGLIGSPHPEERPEGASRRTHGAPPTLALRLGFRQIKGFSEEDAKRLAAAAPYRDADDLWRRSELGRRALERLAEADALRSLGLDRRRGLWALKALGEAPLPLFAAVEGPALVPVRHDPLPSTEIRAAALLPEMTLGEHVVEDYATTSLTLKRHPMAFLRAELTREGLVTARELKTLPLERQLSIAGLVLIRQRPGSANGVVFVTIEDETGIANLILWPNVLERFRRTALGATLLYCRGRLQREESVIHIVAEELRDLTPRLNTLRARTGDEVAPNKKPPFASPEKPPGYDSHDIVVPSRNFR
ncbi:MAG TPA: error-prone DNA polymerase [Stellaceae bacterium]|jgi:error-prone DNA polymerase